ncbi:MAG: methyltransferase domain-containing protein [Proteobacteria bacterium]|jgi:SAM-dependent methyltransferase|nr:methyltransferase domain-containing protein [Pseudomonadota bacterium]
MDPKTIETYNTDTQTIAERHRQVLPTRLYQLAQTFFHPDEKTLDLGCGIGRDTHWLNTHGYPTSGVDASTGMLKIAREDYPQYTFTQLALPELTLAHETFSNIYSCALLMHIPRSLIVSSCHAILKLLKPNGRLILSFRQGENENDGRLFETYHPGQIAQLFESLGGKVLLSEVDGKWNNLVMEKTDLSNRQGIQQIQDIISRDKKTATYKFALLRALCEISRYESHTVTWYREGDMVLVPMKRIAVRWVYYYWPLIKKSVKQTTSEQLAFEPMLLDLPYKLDEFQLLRTFLETPEAKPLLSKVANTIKVGPVRYAGGGTNEIFGYIPKSDASVYRELKEIDYGVVTVPLSLWRDINHFSHWIEDSLSIQWAQLTEKLNQDKKFAQHLDLITKSTQVDERTTYLIRKLFKNKKVECVWTGKILDEFAVDHMIPWSLWRNNDLWNLLPSDVKVNSKKSDLIPSVKLVKKRFDSIRRYWEQYQDAFPELFERELERGLGLSMSDGFSSIGCEALEQKLIKLSLSYGGGIWEG